MILSKASNNNWVPTAGGTGTFIGTLAAFNAVKATLPVNTVAYITDDGNGDLQPVDAITNGDMHPVTSNAVYDKLNNSCRMFRFAINSTARLYFDRSYDFSVYVSSSSNYKYIGSITIPGPWLNDNAGVVYYYRYTNNTEAPMLTITNRTSTYVDVTANLELYVTERFANVV